MVLDYIADFFRSIYNWFYPPESPIELNKITELRPLNKFVFPPSPIKKLYPFIPKKRKLLVFDSEYISLRNPIIKKYKCEQSNIKEH